MYVERINGWGEFSDGPQSGWMYRVNGVFPSYSSSLRVLQDGDVVEWLFTRDLGEDLRGLPSGGGQPPLTPPVNPQVDDDIPASRVEEGSLPSINGEPGASWALYDDGALILSDGVISASRGETSPWHAQREEIQTITIDGTVIGAASLSGLFAGLERLTAIEGLQYIDVSNVQNMSGMFRGASALESLDLSTWDTRHVRMNRARNAVGLDMSDMFAGTYSLRVLSLGENFRFGEASGLPQVPQSGRWQYAGYSHKTDELIAHYNSGEATAGIWVRQEGFADIAGHWAEGAIRFVAEHELMTGVSATEFSPDTNLSRAMLATILWRMEGAPEVAFQSTFQDVQADRWYSQAVIWAFETGIVLGQGQGIFAPNQSITREQFATMLHRYAEFAGYDQGVSADFDLNQFIDQGTVSDWASESMQWAVYHGLVTGTAETTLAPQGEASRAQAATMLQRMIVNILSK